MNKKLVSYAKKMALSLVLVLPLCGCEGMYSDKASTSEDASAKKFESKPDVAVIYVYGDSQVGIPRAMFLYRNGLAMGSLDGGSFFRVAVTPGNHVIGTKSPSARSLQDELTVSAKAGQLYYIKVGYQFFGITGDKPKLVAVEQNLAQGEIRQCMMRKTGRIP